MPAYGVDVGPDTIALEAPLEDAISFRKGCYLGQEVIERVSARGHVNRKLVPLTIDYRPVAVAREIRITRWAVAVSASVNPRPASTGIAITRR